VLAVEVPKVLEVLPPGVVPAGVVEADKVVLVEVPVAV
jgi:hypothetical protein